MDNTNILILDENVDRAKELTARFQEKNISSSIFDESDQKINTIDLKIVLITQQYLAKISRQDIKTLFNQANSKSIVVYDVPNDATKKLAFYKLGAFRVLDKSYKIQDLADYAANILQQFENRKDQEETYFSGSLLDFSISDLIHSFGRDKISGVLRVYSPYCSGKIVFNNGDIDDAMSGYHRGDEAALFMLTWNDGFFKMHKHSIKKPKHKVQLSNIGVLFLGERNRKKFNDIIRKIGHPGISVKIVNRGDLIPQLSDSHYIDVADKLTNYSVLQEILAYSQIDVLELIAWLYDLKKSNHLEIRDDSGIDIDSLPETQTYEKSGMVEHLLGAKEVVYLREILKAEDVSTGKLLVLSANPIIKTDFIHIFNQGSRTPVRTNKELDYTRIDLDDYFSLNVFGIALDKKLKDTIEKISEGLLGYIVLIDAQQPEEIEYTHYIINFLSDLYSVPWTVAVTNVTENEALFDKVNNQLKLPDGRTLIPCDITQKDDIKSVILSLK